jgi:carboxymethylenebutenolidase
MPIKTRLLDLARDGVAGYNARPDTPGPFPAVLLLHHANGVTAEMKIYAAQLASQGYLVLVPRLFEMLGVPAATHIGLGADLQKRFGDGEFLAVLDTAWRHLCADPQARPGRAAAIGFSMGARLAIPFAADHTDVRVLVLHYPSIRDADTSPLQPRHAFDLGARLACATLVFAAEQDEVSPPAMRQELHQVLADNGRPLQWESCAGAGHGFMSPDMPTYDFDLAGPAAQTAAAFLGRHL